MRNLTAAEIVAQLMVARDGLGEWPGRRRRREGGFVPNDGGRFVTNIVFMGMGEPLYNLDDVIAAIDVMSDNEGLGLSRRRITVSTSGVVPQIERLGAARPTPCWRSRSTRCSDELRDELVPLNRKYDDRRSCSMPAAPIRACRTRGASPSNT